MCGCTPVGSALPARPVIHARLHCAAADPLAVAAHEHRVLAVRRELGAHLEPVARAPRARAGRPARSGSSMPLPSTRTVRSARVDVAQTRARRARRAAGPTNRRARASRGRAPRAVIVAVDREQARDLIGVERRRQAPRRLRRLHVHAGVRTSARRSRRGLAGTYAPRTSGARRCARSSRADGSRPRSARTWYESSAASDSTLSRSQKPSSAFKSRW